MDFKEISDLIKLVNKSNLIELKLRKGDFEITLLSDKHGKSKAKAEKAGTTPSTPAAPAQPAYVPPVVPPPEQVAPAKAPVEEKPAAEATEAPSDLLEIRSPMVGTFYRSASPDKPPYIKVGDTIEPGSVVCIIEAMKLFNEIESEISGKVVKVLVEDATPVEYDQVLFLVEP